MKKSFYSFGLATIVAAAFTFTGCSSDDPESSPQTKQGEKPITFTTTINSRTRTTSDPQSTALNTANTVGIFVTSGADGYTGFSNISHTVGSGGALTPSTTMTYPKDESATVNIYAYAPYNSTWSSLGNNNFSVATDQSTDANYIASDLLYVSKTSQATTEDAVNLAFTHKLSLLNITIDNPTLNNTDESTRVDLSTAKVSITGTKITASFNLSDGTVGTATGDATSIKAVSALGTATTACAVIIPQTVVAETELVKVEVGTKAFVAKVPTGGLTFESGKKYNLTVKVPGGTTPMELTVSSIEPWTSSNLAEIKMQEAEVTLAATFGSLANDANATYNAPTYNWTGSTYNLMTVFEFTNGELANYKTLRFTISNLSEGGIVRMGYYVGSNFTSFADDGYSTNGTYTVDLTALGIDLSEVTKISFGGKNGPSEGSYSCDILASQVVLVYNSEAANSGTSGNDSGNSGSDSNELAATFSLPSSNSTNASWNAETSTYGWSTTNGNLLTCFEFSNGELANYSTLTFTYAKSDDFTGNLGMLRIGYYVNNAWTELGEGYGTPGTKNVDLTTISSDVRSTITKICIGGRTGTGSVVLSNMKLTK